MQRLNVNKIFLIFFFTLTLSQVVKAANDERVIDTLIIVYESNSVNRETIITKSINRPELKYPNEYVRQYEISQFRFCLDCDGQMESKDTFPFWFRFIPKDVELSRPYGDFFLVEEEKLVNYRLLDSNWFNHTNWEDIHSFLKKNSQPLFLVDKSYLRQGKLIVIRVEYFNTVDGH